MTRLRQRCGTGSLKVPPKRPLQGWLQATRRNSGSLCSGNSWAAQFRPDNNGEYQTAATGDLPAPARDEVSVQCYHGPAEAEHWIRFDDFRILKLGD